MKSIMALIAIVITTLPLKAQWEPDFRLTNDPGWSYLSGASQRNLASSGDVVHVVWYDGRDGNAEIYYKRSTDAGASWGADTRLTSDSKKSEYPSIAVWGDMVHVAWQDDRDGNIEIYHKASLDGGVTWGADTRLTNNVATSYLPSVDVSGSTVSIVWEDSRDGNTEIYYKRSTDKGVTWEADVRLTDNPEKSYFGSVAASGDFVHVVWSDYRDVDEEIYYKRSSDGGATWSPDVRLTTSSGWSDYPCVSASGPYVHAVWYDFRNGGTSVSQIYYKRSADDGITWEQEICFTHPPSSASYASVASSGSSVHVVWEDNSDIHVKRSLDGGITWDETVRLTNHQSPVCPPITEAPSAAVSGSRVHVAWHDKRDRPTGEIYYKRNPTGNIPTGIEEMPWAGPLACTLSESYPNPSSGTTLIQFQVPSLCHVRLSVHDVFGREAAVVVNQDMNPGRYRLDYHAANLQPGTYFLLLTAGTSSDMKKLVLMK